MFQSSVNQPSIFKLTTHKGIEYLDANNIIRVEAMSNYSKIFFVDGKTLLVSKVLHWFQDNLSDKQFIRISRGQVINKNYIQSALFKDDLKLVLNTGESFAISRRKKKAVLKSFENAA